jgi:uracil-DNA glycosylase family 4
MRNDKWDELNTKIIHCRKCPRLVHWREEIAAKKRHAYQDQVYWGKPVPGFGDHQANVMIVGLAPGAHGSNRTGRMFTGDASGIFLYSALFRAGFTNKPDSTSNEDDLKVQRLFITALCRCAPPANKPTKEEINNCQSFMLNEIKLLKNLQGFVALGQLAFQNIFSIYSKFYNFIPPSRPRFSHRAFYSFGKDLPWLLVSYHPSQQNTQTGKLSRIMFDDIWNEVLLKLGTSIK